MRYTRSAVAIAAAMSMLLAACGSGSDDESVDSALAAAEAEAEALQAELDAVEAENEELSAALTAETDPLAAEATAEEAGEEEATVEEANIEEASTEEEPRSIAPDAVDVAQRWGEALEARDSDALRALYSPHGAHIVDRNGRAAWRDVDAAIESMTNSDLEFTDVELVRVEEFDEVGPVFVAEYEATVFWAPGDGDSLTFVVVFNRFDDDALILEQDIHFYAWSSFVTGHDGYPQRTDGNEGDWINVD